MKKTILSLLIVSIVLTGSYLFYNFKKNKAKEEYFKTWSPKDLNPKSFIELFTEAHNKKPLNFITMTGEFPANWVKPGDVEYLISILDSKKKCCGYMNIFSSTLLNEDADVGGFAIIFMDSYISKTKINLGLNCNPKTDRESVKRIKNWYKNSVNKNEHDK
ncbi:hypothetical protein [Flavobacterium branchiicola]|uniref:Uncharacterized protein n=1 Tax=Flavobacterium branchiicola TaxID=1114875 RepID=A0ABV9PGW6_9FLAO|nr:hypothetical protein [Flavobacterium branchiicola]MBS7254341.1 hypothetical protein [Flavobacterium branchiicola]